jgi:hypothetical protein
MASSNVNFYQKTRTAQQPQPDDANPNTAESMVENGHRTLKPFPSATVAKGSWLLEREEHRTLKPFSSATVAKGSWLLEREEHRTLKPFSSATVAAR